MKLNNCKGQGKSHTPKVFSKEGETAAPKKRSIRQRIIDGEWSDIIAEKESSDGGNHCNPSDSDVYASMHMAKLAAYNRDEAAFHMYFKLAQLDHYIRRDTPRTSNRTP